MINNYVIPGYSNFFQRSINSNGFTQSWSAAAPIGSNSYTYRINYDRTLSPTQLLHVGIGYLYTYQPVIPAATFGRLTF